MRIVSLLPSATEIICRLGLADMLVGVSHACDYPADVVANRRCVTRSALPAGLPACELDAIVITRLRRGEKLFLLDDSALAELAPDLVITQDLCDIGAPSFEDLCAIAHCLPGDAQIVSLAMPELDDLYADVVTIAKVTGFPERGRRLNDRMRARLERVQAATATRPRPGVVTLEWLDPPFTAGYWTPELIRLAGGNELLGHTDTHSYQLSWAQIGAAQPEVLLLMPWGHSAEATARTWASLERPDSWWSIPALRNERVYALDARSFSLRPSPRVIDSVEQIARLLHPTCFRDEGMQQ